MKARIKSSGEIIEVKEWRGASDIVYSTLDMNTFYQASDLDLNIGPPHPEATISGWVARDSERAGNSLHFHRNEVKRGKFYWENKDPDRPIGESLILSKEMFPSLTWQDEPIEVEINIKTKKQ